VPFHLAEIKEQISEINKAVISKEARNVARALRKFFTKTRKHINRTILTPAIKDALANEKELESQLQSYISRVVNQHCCFNRHTTHLFCNIYSRYQLPEPMETELSRAPAASATTNKEEILALSLQPEVEIFLRLITTISLIDNKLFEEVHTSRPYL